MIGTVSILLYLSAALQGVVLAGVILKRTRSNAPQALLLGILVLVFSLHLAEFAAYWTRFYLEVPHLLFATSAMPLLFGPLVYGFVVMTTDQSACFRPRNLLHLVPYAIYLARLAPFYAAPADFKREYFLTMVFTSDPQWPLSTYIMFSVVLVHLGAYLAASWFRLQGSKEADKASSTVAYGLVRPFLFAWVAIAALRALNLFEVMFFGYEYIVAVDHALLLFSSLFIYASVYMMLGSGSERLFGALRPSPEKYARSRLEPAQAEDIAKRAQAVMRRDRLWLDPELCLDSLAARLGESRYHVSQALNQRLGLSFNAFVNEYRIQDLISRMAAPGSSRRSILDLALDAGFRTKATFNNAFKKATGLTPSQYRERLQGQT